MHLIRPTSCFSSPTVSMFSEFLGSFKKNCLNLLAFNDFNQNFSGSNKILR